jgi:hypothetical protein
MTFSDFAHVSIEGQVRTSIIAFLVILGLGVLAKPAAAVVIKFDDATEGIVKVTVDDQPCPLEGSTHCNIREESATFFSPAVGFRLPPMASRVSSVLIMEPPKPEPGGETQFALSDLMTIRLTTSIVGIDITIDFFSDPDASALDGSPEITEDGTFQDLTRLFLRPAGGNFPAGTFPADFKVMMRSDVPVPEPSTLLLIGSGVIAFLLILRLRRRRRSGPRVRAAHPAAGYLDKPTVMRSDLGLEQLAAVPLEFGQCRDLIGPHQAAVADGIGGKDRGQLAAHGFSIARGSSDGDAKS